MNFLKLSDIQASIFSLQLQNILDPAFQAVTDLGKRMKIHSYHFIFAVIIQLCPLQSAGIAKLCLADTFSAKTRSSSILILLIISPYRFFVQYTYILVEKIDILTYTVSRYTVSVR